MLVPVLQICQAKARQDIVSRALGEAPKPFPMYVTMWLMEHLQLRSLVMEVRKKLRTVVKGYRSISPVCHTFAQLSRMHDHVEQGSCDVYFRVLGHILQHCAIETDLESNVRVWVCATAAQGGGWSLLCDATPLCRSRPCGFLVPFAPCWPSSFQKLRITKQDAIATIMACLNSGPTHPLAGRVLSGVTAAADGRPVDVDTLLRSCVDHWEKLSKDGKVCLHAVARGELELLLCLSLRTCDAMQCRTVATMRGLWRFVLQIETAFPRRPDESRVLEPEFTAIVSVVHPGLTSLQVHTWHDPMLAPSCQSLILCTTVSAHSANG